MLAISHHSYLFYSCSICSTSLSPRDCFADAAISLLTNTSLLPLTGNLCSLISLTVISIPCNNLRLSRGRREGCKKQKNWKSKRFIIETNDLSSLAALWWQEGRKAVDRKTWHDSHVWGPIQFKNSCACDGSRVDFTGAVLKKPVSCKSRGLCSHIQYCRLNWRSRAI